MMQMKGLMLVALWVLAIQVSHADPSKFLLITSPTQAKVFWYRVGTFEEEALTKSNGLTTAPSSGEVTTAPPITEPPVLISSGLVFPIGLAYHPWQIMGGVLYVADPQADDGQGAIYSYGITVVEGTVMAGTQKYAVMNTPARWVTVDSKGTLFFTVEGSTPDQGMIMTAPAGANEAKATTVYAATSMPSVSAPGGITTDGYFLFWTNKAEGVANGVLVKALLKKPKVPSGSAVKALAKNSNKAYGVCLSHSNVFFTDEGTFIYGTKQNGGTSETTVPAVSGKLTGPRGCAWDGDGTIFVADSKGNAIYSFSANMPKVRALRQLKKVLDVTEPMGLAVISSARAWPSLLGGVLAVLVTASWSSGLW